MASSHAQLISLLEKAFRDSGNEGILVRGFFDVDGREILASTTAFFAQGEVSPPYPFREVGQKPVHAGDMGEKS